MFLLSKIFSKSISSKTVKSSGMGNALFMGEGKGIMDKHPFGEGRGGKSLNTCLPFMGSGNTLRYLCYGNQVKGGFHLKLSVM